MNEIKNQSTNLPDVSAEKRYQRARRQHWDAIARKLGMRQTWARFYRQRLTEIYRHLVAPGQRVLEIGCARGDLLGALQPAFGLGMDISFEMVQIARQRHPGLHFIQGDVYDLPIKESFDIIILSDVINDLWDVQKALERLKPLCTPRTRLIINTYSRLWEAPLEFVRALGLASPNLYQNWLTTEDSINLLNLAGFESIRNWCEVLYPLPTPLLDGFLNRFLVRLFPFKYLALTNFILARPLSNQQTEPLSVSVVVPARNEQGNIQRILREIPEMGKGTEIIFVEGNSSDDTWGEIQRQVAAHPQRKCQVMQQSGKGKGDAVRLGFERARGDILMILDADLTVPPEDLPRFYNALASNKGEFINGVRLVYPMEKEAMRFFNLLGNKFFSLVFSWLLGQPLKDTLCGTKVLRKTDYELIDANRAYFGDFDPFGDFDLIFGAARLGLKIIDLPVRYRERTYGETNISRWKHGWLLLRMVLFAAGRIKFI